MKKILVASLLPCIVLTALFLFTDRESNAKTDALCDINRGPCVRETEDGITITFDILPKPVIAMSELTFFIEIVKKEVPLNDPVVQLDLAMPGMYMGKNRPVLKPTSDGRFEGKGVITRCPSGRKIWRADVTVETEGKTSPAVFVFEVN